MSLSNPLSEPPKKNRTVNNLAVYSIGGQIGCATLAIVLLSLFIGIGLDKLLGTKPVFTLIFVLGSAPLSLFLTYKMAMRAVKNINPQAPTATQPKQVEEEEKRD